MRKQFINSIEPIMYNLIKDTASETSVNRTEAQRRNIFSKRVPWRQ